MKLSIVGFLVALFLLFIPTAYAQEKSFTHTPIMVEPDEIKHLVVLDNIDVVLLENVPDEISVKVDDRVLDLLRVKISNQTLELSARKFSTDQRITVYVPVNGLESISLKGSAFITAKEVLNTDNLELYLSGAARIALRTSGKIKVKSLGDYEIISNEKYHVLYSAEN